MFHTQPHIDPDQPTADEEGQQACEPGLAGWPGNERAWTMRYSLE